jgi:hypothetical protein
MTERTTPFPPGFDYSYRPISYFHELDPQALIVASILGEERRKDVQQRLAAGGTLEGDDWLTESKLDASTRQVIGSLHPAFMGGEYLPAFGEEEIEIARIVLASVTQDVISIRARRAKRSIIYRIVDEYESNFTLARKSSAKPLTFRELISFIDGSFHEEDEAQGGLVFSILQTNIDAAGDSEGMRNFIAVASSFYPGLKSYYALAIAEYLDSFAVEEDEEGL